MDYPLVRAGLLLLVAVAVLTGFTPSPFPRRDPSKQALLDLQGSWVPLKTTFEGRRVTEGGCDLMVIQGNRMWFVRDGRKLPDWSITVDARKHPMAFDQVRGSRVYRGIYHLDGNTLTICVREGLAESCRPAGFDEKEGVIGEVYTRQ
jgi:uncharacterized protein (TIGR03067 family)